jgi:hypothetical protein
VGALAAWWGSIDWTATATVVLAILAGVQVTREVRRGIERRAGLRRRLRAKAWLARRSCEVTLRSAPGMQNSAAVAVAFTRAPAIDRLQRHFEEVLALSSAVGGDDARHGERAFGGFLAAADRFNEVVWPTTPATAKGSQIPVLCDAGLSFLYDAVVELAQLAPRQPHEPALPDRATLRLAPPQPPATPLQPPA